MGTVIKIGIYMSTAAAGALVGALGMKYSKKIKTKKKEK